MKMNSYYNRMLDNYRTCSMSTNISERESLITYSVDNSERFLSYNLNFKKIKKVDENEKWKPYTKYKYKNIRTSLERNISEIDGVNFKTSECKYCGQLKEEREIEHVLPKANYPEFAIFVPNLVCACGTCNKKKPDDLPISDNIIMYPHPRYELYTSFEIVINLIYGDELLHNQVNLIYHGTDEVVARWNKLKDDLELNKRISNNVVKTQCDWILKLIKKGKSFEEVIEKYNTKIEDEDYSTELEKQIYTGLIRALKEI